MECYFVEPLICAGSEDVCRPLVGYSVDSGNYIMSVEAALLVVSYDIHCGVPYILVVGHPEIAAVSP